MAPDAWTPRRRSRSRHLRWLTVVPLVALMTGAAQGSSPEGYLLFLEASPEGVSLRSAAAVDRSIEPRPLPAADGWRLELRDHAGRVVWSRPLANPWRTARDLGRHRSAPFSVVIPALAEATVATVHDQDGRERLAVPLDAAFVARAELERRRFEDSARRNRERVERMRTATASRSSAPTPARPITRLDHLEPGLRGHLEAQVARDAERLRRFGLAPQLAPGWRADPARAGAWRRIASAHDRPARPATGAQVAVTRDHTLTGRVRSVETGNAVSGAPLFFYLYDFDWEYVDYLGTTSTSSGGYYAMRVGEGNVIVYCGSPSNALYAGQIVDVRVIDDSVADISLFPGVMLTGIARAAEGGGIPNLRIRGRSPRFLSNERTDSTGRFRMVVPRGLEFRFWAEPDPPLLTPEVVELRLDRDRVHDLTLARGWELSGRVTAAGGGPLMEAAVILRHLGPASAAAPGWSATSGSDGSYAIAVPRDLRPTSFALSVHREGFVRHAAGIVLDRDLRHDVVLSEGIQVTGTVRDRHGTPLEGAVIRAFADGAYVTSADTDEDGSYRLGLEAGTYTFTAGPYQESAPAPLAPAEARDVPITAATSLDFTLPPAEAVARVRLLYPSEEAFGHGQGVIRLEVRQHHRPVLVTLDSAGQAEFDESAQTWARETLLYLEAGTYDLRVYALGCDPITVRDVTLAAGSETLIERTLAEPYVWTGVLRSADGTPLPHLQILSYDDLATQLALQASDGQGRFSVPLTPGGTLRFFSPDHGTLMRRIERVPDPTAGRTADCVLEELGLASDSGGVVTRIWGTGDPAERYDLVILGDGYTDLRESFTDTNGNGIWDGVLFVDLDGNGLWDGPPERFAIYGEAPPPALGTDPTVGNEPFDDLNGDGVPNLDDQATFDRDAAALLRSLFGSDVWSEARDVFNVYRVRLISEQAGMDIYDQDNRLIQSRDTVLGSWIDTPDRGFLLGVEDPLVQQYVNRYAPHADTHIVLINQPVQIGRANSYILMRGGATATTANTYVMSHEMGHNVGGLADEYEEFSDTWEGPELLRPNITTSSDRDRIPWSDLIPEGVELPSAELTPGVGLYEGAYYRPGGVYRPVHKCSMRGSERFCPVCTREIRVRLSALTGVFPGTLEPIAPRGRIARLRPAFEWRGPAGASHYRLELDAVGGEAIERVDVWASRHTLVSDLAPATSYRWRVRPGSEHVWGSWSEWVSFETPPLFDGAASGVAAAPGREGSDWHSDLWLHDAGDGDASVRLCFAPAGSSVDLDGCAQVRVGSGETAVLRDVVATTFGLNASGAVLWQVTEGDAARLLVEGRTSNRISAHEQMGHAVFGRPWSEAPAAGVAQVVPIASGARFRTNLDLVTDQDCERARLVIRNAEGTVKVDEMLDVEASGWLQLGDVVSRFGLDPTAVHVAEIAGVGCRIVAGASVIDNLSNDATRMLGQSPAAGAGSQWVIGAAYLSGSQGSRWRSGLTLVGDGGPGQRMGLTFVPRQGGWDQRRRAEVALGAGGLVTFDNTLQDVFGMPEGSVGSLRVEPESGRAAAVFMRTYAEDGELTYGQYVPPWPAGRALAPGVEGRLVGLSHGPTFRTNLLLQNTHAGGTEGELRPTIVRVELLDATGNPVASRALTLGPGENLQLNGLVPELLGPGAELADFVVVLTVGVEGFLSDSTGGVLAAASEVNGNQVQGTNDPRLVTARMLTSPR